MVLPLEALEQQIAVCFMAYISLISLIFFSH